jgi:membrane-associated protein
MTDTLLALVPTYGVWLIFGSVLLSCFALPIPSSILVMTAGGFAASGDLVLWQVVTAAFGGFVIGDQGTYHLARKGGPAILTGLRKRPKSGALLNRAERMLERRGAIAVYLSRTIVSPLGPYLGYLSGALGLGWVAYTIAAILGAGSWAVAYAGLGFAFADQITQLAQILSNFGGFVIAGAVAALTGRWIWKSWTHYKAEHQHS